VIVIVIDAPCGRAWPGHGRRGWGGWKLITGLVGLGFGTYLVATDGDCKTTPPAGVTCADVYNNAVPGYLSLGGGVAFAALTVYLVVRGSGNNAHRVRRTDERWRGRRVLDPLLGEPGQA